MIYILTKEEIREVESFVDRILNNTDYQRNQPLDKSKTLREWYIESFGAELACCKIIGSIPDFNVHKKSSLIDTVKNGYNIDVKLSNSGYLIVDEKYKNNKIIDIYCLMRGKSPNYEYLGWNSKRDLFSIENKKEIRFNTAFCIEAKYLNKEEISCNILQRWYT